MASDLRIQGEVVVNSEQAEGAFNRVGDKAQQMATEVATSATKAGQAVDKIGDGAGASAEKFTRAESRISASIKRATNELELLGKTASQRLEFNISDKGLDAAKFEPALKKLRELEAQAQQAQRAASGSLDKMGISAAQTAAALRGVPAQFTDIVTSLQGGQAPLTVFLQQGGQLKDMFGGAGNAARALGGYVLGLVNPFTIAAAAVAGIAVAYNQGAKEADAYRAALVTTGNAAGTTATQLKSYAQEISGVVGTQGKAAESLAAMAATGKIGAESLREAAQAAVAYERATGQAVGKTAEQFASLRGDPLSAVLKLNDGMNFLTDSTYRQIKSLEEQGKTAEAANVAQRAFADTLSVRAGEMERNLGTVERGWLAVKDAAKSAWDAILNVGRASTSVDQLAEVRKQIAQRENQIANGGFGTNEGGAAFGRPSQAATERLRAELAGLQAKAAALEGVAYATRVSAEEERKRGEAVKAGAAFDKAGEKFLTDKIRMERELAAARVQGAEAGRSQAEIEKRLGEIRASYAKKGGSSVATENKDLRDQQRIFAELADVSSTYYSELAAAQEQRAKGNIGEAQYIAYVNDLIQKQPFAVALAKDEAAANVALSKAYADAAAERVKTIQSMERAADGLQSQNDALREEIELIGLSTEQQTVVLQQRNDVLILTKEATLAELERQSAITGTQTRVEIALASEIAALKERNALLGAKGVKNAAVDAAKSAADEWQKTSDKINDTLTDALMRGFESGKDFAKNLRDTVVNMFKTMVLRPIISAVVNPVAGAITGALGLAGTASAGTSAVGAIGSGASLLGSAGSLLGGAGSAAGYGFSALMSGNGLGALSGGLGMLTSGGPAAIMAQGAGMIAGVLGPIALGIGALTAIIGKTKGETRTGGQFGVAFGGAVTNNRRDQTYTVEGQQYDRDFTNGLQTALKDGIAYRLEGDPVAQESAIREAVAGTASGINGFLKALGSTATLSGFSAGLETSGKGRGGVFAGGLLSTGAAFGESGKGDNYAGTLYEAFSTNSPDFKTALENFTLDLKQSTIQALQTVSDIPQAVQKMLQGVDAEALTEDAANKLLETINAQIVGVETLRKSFENIGLDKLAEMSFDAASGLAAAAGGFDALNGKLATYYDAFYSEEEKRANTVRAVSTALAEVGLELPKTRAEFRALVEAQMALGDSGTGAVAALLGVSGAFASITEAAVQVVDATSIERKDRLAAQRAQEKQAAEALQKQIEAYADGAEEFSALRDSLLKAGDAAGLLAAATERAFADPSGRYMNGRYELPRWEEGTTAAGYNYQYGQMQARMRQQLGDAASANALRIENVKDVLGAYSVESMMSEYDTVTGPIKIAIQQAIVDASGDIGFAVRDAVQGAALYAAMADVRGQFTSSGPGLASIAAARATAADASRTSIDPATGLYRIGGAAVEYGKALDSLQAYMRSGAIDADTFERAVEALGAALPGAAESVGTLEDAIAAVERASFDVGTAGLNSIRYYFGSLSDLTAEFAKAAAEAQEPIAQTTAAIGRLNSAQSAFGGSAAAALEGFGGGGLGGAQVLQNTAVMKDITRAQLIAEAAGIASAAMTTADAAAAAAKLAKSPAFAELDAAGIRDASLLLDGISQYNAQGFEVAFTRISAALAKGSVTDAQYKALFDVALDVFEGVPEETRALIDSMTYLRDAMSGFADGLLIDEQRTTLSAGATLAEMQRQYAQAFAGASTGDNDAIGKYQQLANTLLDKELYSTQAEYNAAFGSVYGDARQLEAIGINTMANAQGSEMVSELKDMNAKLNKRVEDLEKNLLAALAQIAKNTSETSRGIEQQIVMAEDTP